MSSSQRPIHACQAVIEHGRTPSPVLLPESTPDQFVEEFNHTYARLGWTLKRVQPNVLVEKMADIPSEYETDEPAENDPDPSDLPGQP